jgi:hypothetical protein
MTEYSTGEELEIDDQIYLAATRPHSAGCGGGSCVRI